MRQLGKGEATPTVIAAFSGVLFVFTVANLAIGVVLAPRYAEPSPDAVYGNNLAQQITSTFDVVICLLSLTVLIAMLFTGPLAGYLVRRREARVANASAPRSSPHLSRRPHAAPTIVPPTQPVGDAENCSAQRGFDDGAPGSGDGGVRRAHHRAADPAARAADGAYPRRLA